MVFSSIPFLYFFLPILLLSYYIVPKKFKNFVLLCFSFLFYFYGETTYTLILFLSCFVNYMAGILMGKTNKPKFAKIVFISAIIFNVGMLMYFKYMNFFIDNINILFKTDLSFLNIIMPIGISFFTFQTLSYIIAVYTKKVPYENNFISFATYVALFPQLVAGPIVRYEDISKELNHREHSFSLFFQGIQRFSVGLAKKIFLANALGELCKIIALFSEQTILSTWISAIGFTLQIYFDFSGYSDMAIGLGLMFGFHFLENFNYPYIAKSIRDFWKRWHISLSSWFKDYIYIPLGGSRVSSFKWIRNIAIVWFLTGFWHGAAWNFILWGLYFAVLLVLEKKLFSKFLDRHSFFGHVYTIFFVLISFVIFNSASLYEIGMNLKNLFGFGHIPLFNQEIIYYFRSYFILILFAVFACTPFFKLMIARLKKYKIMANLVNIIEPFYYIGFILLSTAYLIDASFNPFLYFRF